MRFRVPILRAAFALASCMVIDSFAGGGGASSGMELALGRPVDVAINHDEVAIEMHRRNHPDTRHYCQNIWEVDPREVCQGREVGVFWASPDCKHHSRAKGGKPRDKNIRGLAWVVVRWARDVRPARIFLENVAEFEEWGPLLEDGTPDPMRRGEEFRAFIAALTDLGYDVDWRFLVAADYGAPTTRKRLYLIARCDGAPIVWPAASHGPGRRLSWRSASEIIDWTLECPSIFDRARPLADKTLRRVAVGVQRYVIDAAEPFIVPGTGVDLISPSLIQTGYGERKGQTPRVLDLMTPLGTVVAGGQKHALVAALLTKHYGGVIGHGVQRPVGTITAKDHHSVTAATLLKFYGTSSGAADVRAPLPTVLSGGGKGGGHIAAVHAFLTKYYSAGGARCANQNQELFAPLHTVPTHDRFALVMVYGEPYVISDVGMRMLQPHELFAAMGFPADYVIRPSYLGKPISKASQVSLAGNAVAVDVAHALVAANVEGCPAPWETWGMAA